jgi:hypothetical protein
VNEYDVSAPENMEGIFDAIGKAAKSVGKAVGGAASAVDKVYVSATPRWLRQGVGIVTGGTQAKLAFDTASALAQGQRIDRAFMGAVQNQVDAWKGAAPFIQLGLQVVPGIGQGASAAIGAGLALAEGKPITEAAIAAAKSALPGGPIAQKAMDVGLRMVSAAAAGKPLDVAVLEAARAQLPGGKLAQMAFDAGLALAQGKKLQDAGLSAAAHLVPKNALAQGAFEMTKNMLRGGGAPGAPAARRAPGAPAARARRSPIVVRPTAMRSALAARRQPPAGDRAPLMLAPPEMPAPPASPAPLVEPRARSALPIALGALALAGIAGGAWWWTQTKRSRG